MTLIAALRPHSGMLLGDLLISEHQDGDAPLSPFRPTFLPSVGFTAPPDPNASGQIITTRQKLALITDHLAVGWSGPCCVARKIVTAMLEHFPPGPITYDDVQAFWTACDYDDLYRSGIQFVGLYSDHDHHGIFERNTNTQMALPFFGTSFVGGRGSQTFVDLCCRLDAQQGVAFPPPESGAPLDHLKALTIIGFLTASEAFNPDELYTTYSGGFYESILMFGKTMAKLDDVTFTYSHYILDRKRSNAAVRVRPLMFLKVHYVGDVLVIKRIHTENYNMGPKNNVNILAVLPLHRDVTIDEIKDIAWSIDMNSKHYCHVTFIQGDDGKWHHVVQVEVNPELPGVKVVEEDGRQIFGYTEAFFLKTGETLIKAGLLNVAP